jgi:hypothetical protein
MAINKKYLSAALAVGISTAGGPFAMNYSIPEKAIPYCIGMVYLLACSGAGLLEFYIDRRNQLLLEDPRKFCEGNKRLTIEELVSQGYLSLDE